MNDPAPLKLLSNARRRELPWSVIVKSLRDLEGTGPTDEHGRPWLQVVSEVTGFTTNQLRQADRTFAVIETLIKEPNARKEALSWPLSNLEVISRIAKADQDKAKQILSRSTPASFRELRGIYNRVREASDSRVSHMSAGHRSARRFMHALFAALSDPETLQRILDVDGTSSTLRPLPWPGGFRYAHPDLVVVRQDPQGQRLSAFEGLRVYGDVNRDASTKAILKAAVESTFFAHYYLCLPTWSPSSSLLAMKGELALSSVGLITIGDEPAKVVVRPRSGPSPNRQALLLDDSYMRRRLGLDKTPS